MTVFDAFFDEISPSFEYIAPLNIDFNRLAGQLDSLGEEDFFAVDLVAGRTYRIDLRSNGEDPIEDTFLAIFSDAGQLIATDNDGGIDLNARLVLEAAYTGIHYLSAASFGATETGTYDMRARDITPDDFGATPADSGVLVVDGPRVDGTIDQRGDEDWFAVELTEGRDYRFDLRSVGENPLADPFLSLFDSAGTPLVTDDNSGSDANARLTFTPTASGTYYLGAERAGEDDVGTYDVRALDRSPPELTPVPGEDFGPSSNYGASVDTARLFVVALHGRGGNVPKIVNAVLDASPGDVAIYGAVPASGEGSWWGVGYLKPVLPTDSDLIASLEVVDDLIQYALDSGFSYDEIVIAGFSQGASLALEYAVRSPAEGGGAGRPFRAIVAMSGALLGSFTEDEADRYTTPITNLNVYLGGYEGDRNVPLTYVERTEGFMVESLGAPVTHHIEPGARHAISGYDVEVALTNAMAAA